MIGNQAGRRVKHKNQTIIDFWCNIKKEVECVAVPNYEVSDIRKKISECFYAFDLDPEWNFENLYLTTDLELKDLLLAIQALINLRIIDFTIDVKTKLPVFNIADSTGYEKYKPICRAKYIINQWNN